MKRLSLPFVITALFICIVIPATAMAEYADITRAAQKFKQMVEDGRTENLMTRVELYPLAGLSYQAGLTVPQENALACKTVEQKRVLSGMYVFDMNYAMVFGNAKQAMATQRFYRDDVLPELPVSSKVEMEPVNANLVKKILADPNNPELRAKMLNQAKKNTLRTAEAATDPEVMQFVVDSFYGSLLEGLYIACTLTKNEEQGPETAELFMAQLERFQTFNDLFSMFDEDKSKALMKVEERNGYIGMVINRISATNGRLTAADIEGLLALTEAKRAALAKTCN